MAPIIVGKVQENYSLSHSRDFVAYSEANPSCMGVLSTFLCNFSEIIIRSRISWQITSFCILFGVLIKSQSERSMLEITHNNVHYSFEESSWNFAETINVYVEIVSRRLEGYKKVQFYTRENSGQPCSWISIYEHELWKRHSYWIWIKKSHALFKWHVS